MRCDLVFAVIMVFLWGVSCPIAWAAQMSSDNYRITTTVFSGGGMPMGSAGFLLNGTLGQPSPLMDPVDPPYSANYELFGGFWYTLGAGGLVSNCPADFEPDGDVDEDDLITLAADFGLSGVGRDADGDMDMDGLDLYQMANDFNRTDCFD